MIIFYLKRVPKKYMFYIFNLGPIRIEAQGLLFNIISGNGDEVIISDDAMDAMKDGTRLSKS